MQLILCFVPKAHEDFTPSSPCLLKLVKPNIRVFKIFFQYYLVVSLYIYIYKEKVIYIFVRPLNIVKLSELGTRDSEP